VISKNYLQFLKIMKEFKKNLKKKDDENDVKSFIKIKILKSFGVNFPLVGRDYLTNEIYSCIESSRKEKKDKQDLNSILYLSSAPGTGKSKILHDLKNLIEKSKNIDEEFFSLYHNNIQ
jgi:predicted Ser/Thr protein kinase